MLKRPASDRPLAGLQNSSDCIILRSLASRNPASELFSLSPEVLVNTNVTRIFDPSIVNEVCNHPKVRPWLGGDLDVDIDVTTLMQSPNNIVLQHDGFYAIFVGLQPGVFEIHTQASAVTPPKNVIRSTNNVFRYMFTKTNCIEIITRIPDANIRARKLANVTNFSLEFRVKRGWQVSGVVEDCDVYSLPLTRWISKAPGLIVAGEDFRSQVEEACAKDGIKRAQREDDINDNRFAGAAFEMLHGGQVGKAVLMYNRWAVMAGYMPIAPISLDPLIIHIGDVALRVYDEKLEVLKFQ